MTLELNKKTSHQNKLLINIILFIIFVIFVVYFILIPTLDKIKKLRIDIANTKIEINSALEKGKNINNQADKLKTIESQIEKLDKVFINRNRELEFITTLEGLASKNNVEQTFDLKNIPDFETSEFLTIPILIKVKGEFNDVINYLIDLETMAYYVNISNLEMTTTGRKKDASFSINQDNLANNSNIITADITANTYFK